MILGLPPFEADDVHFLIEADRIVRGVVAMHSPPRILVFRIDNWFGEKWLRFSGKALGALGVWDNTHTVVPPFVQNRITAQSLFEQTVGNQYSYAGAGPQIHHDGPSSHNLTNRAKRRAPDTALFWFSGNSKLNGRGSIMGYTPTPKQYWGWYLEFSRSPDWKISKQVDFHETEIEWAENQLATLIGT